MHRNASISQAACSLALFFCMASVQAGSFSVNPVRLSLSAAQPTGSLTVRNDGAEATTVQLEVLEWSQQDGQEILQPSQVLLATPPIFSVPAGGRQVIRVGLRQAPNAQQESTYRLLLRELPLASEEPATGLKMALNISLPVFVLPAGGASPEMHWTATQNAPGSLTLRGQNSGNAHVKVTRLSLYDSSETLMAEKATSDYILAGQSREWTIKTDIPVTGSMTLRAATQAGDLVAVVDLTKP